VILGNGSKERHCSNPARPEAVELGRRPKMISLRLAVPAVLAAATVAGCFTFFVTSASVQVEADQRLPPTVLRLSGPDATASTSIDLHPTAEEKAAAAYWEAAQAILRRAPNARASAGFDKSSVAGPIPLPKRRPITRP
jgi:hypothetical protein